jgi:hypothetical protein
MQVLSGVAKPGKSTELTSTTTTNQHDNNEDNGAKALEGRVSDATKAKQKEWYEKNKAVILANAKETRAKAKETHDNTEDTRVGSATTKDTRVRSATTKAYRGKYIKTPEFKARNRKWYQTNKVAQNAKKRKRRGKNIVKTRAYNKKQYAKKTMKNHLKKTQAAYSAWYRATNKQTINATAVRKYAANKDRLRILRTTRKALPAVKARLLAYQALPATKERIRARNKARAKRVNTIEKDYVTEFLRTHPDVQPKSHLITDAQIDGMLIKLLDSRTPTILEALHGFTLREAFVNRKLYASLYIWLARGSGVDQRPGQNYAECERFLVRDPNPILTNADMGTHYKVGTPDFKGMGLVSIPLATFDTASACSRFESRMQNFFDFRRYGMEKLWKKAGAGKLYQKYRRSDIAAMQNTNSNALVYTCGITVLHDVRMASTDSNNVLSKISSGGEGVLSKVNSPARWASTLCRDRHMFGSD